MGQEQLYDVLVTYHQQLDQVPAETHLFCPKIDDDDPVNYEEPDQAEDGVTSEEKKARLKALDARQQAASYLSLLLGMADENVGSWLDEWQERTEKFLKKCDACVRKWHQSRDSFIRLLLG